MPFFYVDTSVLVKRYRPESGSDFVNQLYEFHKRRKEYLYTSNLTIVEFCSAIMRLRRENRLGEEEAMDLMAAFSIESDSMIHYLMLDREIISSSIRILSLHSLRSHDAIQLASGLEVKEFALKAGEEFFFVCDDDRLCAAAEREDLQVLKPRVSQFPVALPPERG